jgi:hypothetical protein
VSRSSRITSIAVRTPFSVSYVSTRNVVRSGKSCANARKASASDGNDSMYECAIVPAACRPKRRAASTLLVAAKPTIAVVRATAIAASAPCVRRNAKSTICRSRAAIRHRAAFDAIVVWNVTMFSRYVSTSCAIAIGAVISINGSSANTMRPSGIAHTSPSNRSLRNRSIASGGNARPSRRYARSSSSNANPSRKSRHGSRPAATRNPRFSGRFRTNRLNVAS